MLLNCFRREAVSEAPVVAKGDNSEGTLRFSNTSAIRFAAFFFVLSRISSRTFRESFANLSRMHPYGCVLLYCGLSCVSSNADLLQTPPQLIQTIAVKRAARGVAAQRLPHLRGARGAQYHSPGMVKLETGRIEGQSAEIQQSANDVIRFRQ